MDHAEAQDRLGDLALEPGRLARLEIDGAPETVALLAHVAECERCRSDLEGWRRTWAQIGIGISTSGGAAERDLDVIRAPASLRTSTLAAIAHERASGTALRPQPKATRRARRRPSLSLLAVAAALVIAIGAGALAVARSADLDHARAENAALAETAATLDRVLATPVHWVTTLRSSDGTAGGTVAWTAGELVVITTGLPGPAHGQAYRCWVERDGVRTPIGWMKFSGATGYWAGSMANWASAFAPGAQFGVSLIPDGGIGTSVLVGAL